MNTKPISVTALLGISLFAAGVVAEPIDSIQTDVFDGATALDDVSNVIRVTAGGVQYRNFLTPTEVDITGGGASPGAANLYEGTASSAPVPMTLSDVLLNRDITRGYTDPTFNTPVNVMFGQTINGTAGQQELFLFDITTGDNWTVTAITGGTATAPVLGGSTSIVANDVGIDTNTVRANGTPINVQSVYGFGVDINNDLGESSLIGVRVTSNGADPSVVLASTGPGDSLTAATSSNSGLLTNLESVTTNVLGTVAASDLIGVSVFHLHGAQNSNNVLSPGATDPGGAARTSLMEDLALNTGIINPGTTGTLTAAQQAALGPTNSVTNGLGVNFDGGLRNGPGIDLVVFEIAPNGFADVDAFLVNRVDGIEGSLRVTENDYSVTGANLGTQLVNADATDLNAFIAGGWGPGGGVTQPWVGVGIDLSDLGYSEFEVVDGLLFSDAEGGGNIDFTLIAGLPHAVPEPTSIALWTLLSLALVSFSACKSRRK